MTTTSHLAFYSRDGFFCKDGRGWHGTAGGHGHGLDWPWPSTLRGAVRSLWGRSHDEDVGRDGWLVATRPVALGPTLTLWRDRCAATLERRWPVPADVEYVEASDDMPAAVRYLEPQPSSVSTLGRDDDRIRERLWVAAGSDRRKPRVPPRWWTEPELVAWITRSDLAARPATTPLRPARRRVTRVAMESAAQTALDGALFSHDVIETLETTGEWAIAAEVCSPDAVFGSVATLGSDRRLARVEAIDASLFAPPPALETALEREVHGLRLMTVTPAIFRHGWLPDPLRAHDGAYMGRLPGCPHDVVLRAAMVPRPMPISGWDVVDGAPRRTDLAVAPGAVFFVQRADGGVFAPDHVRGLWLAALGRRTDDGFGRVVAAPWHPGGSAAQ